MSSIGEKTLKYHKLADSHVNLIPSAFINTFLTNRDVFISRKIIVGRLTIKSILAFGNHLLSSCALHVGIPLFNENACSQPAVLSPHE